MDCEWKTPTAKGATIHSDNVALSDKSFEGRNPTFGRWLMISAIRFVKSDSVIPETQT